MISDRDEQLVYLLSMPRSGSTLLSLMLGSHPEVCCPPEPWIVLALAEYLELGNVRSTPYGREWAEIAAIEFLLKPEKKQRGALGKTLRKIVGTPALDTIMAAKQILQTAYQLHLDVSGKSVFVDKTPRYYTVLGLIDEIFPRAKKIVLLRNPLDIFASYKATWDIARTIFTAEGITVHARDFCEGLFKIADYTATSRADVLVLRYEDLAGHPESALRSVCEFSNIDFSPTMLAYYENTALIDEYRRSPVGDPVSSSQPKPANNQTVNAWEKRLDEADIQALIDVLGVKIFEDLGYGDTVARLRGMSVDIPTEEQALERRNVLMRSLADHVQEQPFSAWNNFVSPLKGCQADQTARLEVIRQQQADLERLRQQHQAEMEGLRKILKVADADRAARLEVIQQQQAELDRMQTFRGFLGSRYSNLKKRIYGSHKK
jgi:hypothetical protein